MRRRADPDLVGAYRGRVPLETPDQVLEVLAATPRRIATATASAGPAQLDRRPSPQEWSAAEVLAHLRACSDVWGGCIAQVLRDETPTIRAVNPRTWIDRTDYAVLPFSEHVTAFAAQRAQLLGVLEPLAPAGWQRNAVVIGAGRPLERTVLSYAVWLASHERPHVKQVERTVAALRGVDADDGRPARPS